MDWYPTSFIAFCFELRDHINEFFQSFHVAIFTSLMDRRAYIEEITVKTRSLFSDKNLTKHETNLDRCVVDEIGVLEKIFTNVFS